MAQSAKEKMLAELAGLCGLEPQYYDVAGNLHVIEPDTQAAILSAMGYRCQHLDDLEHELEQRRLWPWSDLLEPVLALSQTKLAGAAWNLYLPLSKGRLSSDLKITWELKDENGNYFHKETVGPTLKLAEIRSFGKAAYGRIMLPLPANLPLGYYVLFVQIEYPGFQKQGQMLLVIAPDRMHIPEDVASEKIWGVTLPLYALRSSHNWGIGDCGDLRRLLTLQNNLTADVVGLNPLHHLGFLLEHNISPYYPTTRCYANPLYLDLNLVPELSDSKEVQEFLHSQEILAKISSLQEDNHVNYVEIARLKLSVLAKLLDTFISRHGLPDSPNTARGRDFADYVTQDKVLRKFATFLALSEYLHAQGEIFHDWQQWPANFQDPADPAVAEFARQHERQLLCHMYAQWLLSGQLQETQAQARNKKMMLGLYLDLAVGINPGGFDTWANQDLFALTVNIGAPPDDFSPLGQNWGLAPLQPRQLRDQGFRYFSHVLRQNCPVGGALRIDHVMGLFRLFWIPRGASPAQGAYVRYPADDMLKIMALESYKQKALVIGEDLGTVPPYIREQLAEYRVLSTRLFYFERQENGDFKEAAQYPEWSMASITTHDLPTLCSFWQGRDIQLRQELNLFPDDETAVRAREERDQAKYAILTLLQDKGWINKDDVTALAAQVELPAQVKWGIIAHLAQTPSRLVLLSLEDIFGWLDQQNLPGTMDEYPNWRQKFPLLLEELVQARELEQVAEIMRCYSRGETK
jgi:4-alpha-glucanotransferase